MPVLDSGARGVDHDLRAARHRRRADRLGERGVSWRSKELGADKFEIVAPSVSILAEPPVAVVDKVVDKHGTREVAEAYLEYLYTPRRPGDRGEELLSPASTARSPPKYAEQFPKLKLFTIDDVFGGWTKAQKTHFADGGISTRSTSRERDQTAWRKRAHDVGMRVRPRRGCVTPAFSASTLRLGYTILYLCAHRADSAVDAVRSRRRRSTWAHFWAAVTSPRVVASYRLSFGASLGRRAGQRGVRLLWSRGCWCGIAFPGTAHRRCAGRSAVRAADRGRRHRARRRLYAPNGWFGAPLAPLGIKVAFTPLGVLVALTFIGLPFVVRTRAAGARGSRRRGRGSGREPRRERAGRPFSAA